MDRRDWFARVARGGAASGASLGLAAFADRLVADEGTASPSALLDEDIDAALERLGASGATPDARLVVEVTEEAWSGAFVGVRVDASGLGEVRALHVLRDDHVPALLASLEPRAVRGAPDGPTSSPARLALPVRLDRPCRVHALARTRDGWSRASGRVRTVGAPGCG